MRQRLSILLLALGLAACTKFDRLLEGVDPVEGSLALALPTSAVTVAQGREQAIAATVTRRGEFKSDIAVTVEGLPPGVTVVVGSPTTSGQQLTTTLTLRVAAGTKLGDYTLTIRAHADPAANATTILLLTVTEQPAYAFAISRPAMTIVKNGIAPVVVRLARTNFTPPVTLSLTGAAGISASFAGTPISGDSVAGTIAVAGSVSPGTYALTLRGTTTDLPEQTAALSVTVTSDAIQVLTAPQLNASQGTTVSAQVVVNRNGFSGPVLLAAEDLPNGVTASFDPASANGASATMSLAVGPTAPAGSFRFRLKGTASSVADASTDVDLAIAGSSIALTLDSRDLSVFQGGAIAATTLRVARTAFTGGVAVTVENAPAGLTVTPNPATITADTARISVSAAASAAAGQYDVVLRATPAGFPASASKTATLAVTIRPAPPVNGNVLLDWSQCTAPSWVAYQDGAGQWTQAALTSGVTRFTIASTRGGIAYVEAGNSLTVRYMTQAELIAQPFDMCPPKAGTKSVVGLGVHSTTLESATWRLGGGAATSTGARPSFSIGGVREGPNDLIGWGATATQGLRGLIRRDVDLPDGGSLGSVDLLSVESFAPTGALLTVNGYLSSDVSQLTVSYLTTPACTVNQLLQSSSTAMTGVPSAAQRATDYHLVTLSASAGTRNRSVSVSFHTMSNRVVSLPAAITTPVVTAQAGSYKRLQAALGAVPGVYNATFALRYNDGSRSVGVSASPGYVSNSVVTLVVPDLSGVSGWSNSYAPPAGAAGSWVVSLDGGTSGPLCSEGKTSYLTTYSGAF